MSTEFLANDPGRRLAPSNVRYRFGVVEADTGRGILSVAGAPVDVQPLAFRLLVILCEAGGAVVSREELLRRLWPDQVVVSDESLTKVIHRLRTALGVEGERVRTVRKMGVRLDAPLSVVAAPQQPAVRYPTPTPVRPRPPIALPEPRPALVVPKPATPQHPQRRALVLAVAALLPLAFGSLWWWARSGPQILDAGYALSAKDLGASRPETVSLVRQAFAASGGGNRARARALLEAAHESDPSTPIPAVFLSLWSRVPAGHAPSERWAQQAEARLNRNSTPYQRLLVRYAVLSADERTPSAVATASAILDQRPQAWSMRLARAHFHLGRRDRKEALDDLRLISVHELPSLNLALVLGDRASLGDAAAVERDLADGALSQNAAFAKYVRGRIAWSRGHPEQAMREFSGSVNEATIEDGPDLQLDSRLLAAAMAAEIGLPSARALFDQIVAHARAQDVTLVTFEALGMGAYLSAAEGDFAARDRRLAEAAIATNKAVHLRVALAFAAFETGGPQAEDVAALAEEVGASGTPEMLGTPELLLARQSFARGDRGAAARLLAEARSRGVERSYYAESAPLLAAELGQRTALCARVDPPYPNLLRFATCARLRRLLPPPAAR
jgi:DNA-binding winged helix-turn-helix (wHTH) protein